MAYSDTPAPYGASKALSRDEHEKKPYKYQPYPKLPVIAPPPEPTISDLKAVIAQLTLDDAGLRQTIAQLNDEIADLKGCCADQLTEIQNLHAPKKSKTAAAKE